MSKNQPPVEEEYLEAAIDFAVNNLPNQQTMLIAIQKGKLGLSLFENKAPGASTIITKKDLTLAQNIVRAVKTANDS